MREQYGPNDLMPCGNDVAKRRHLAKGEECDTCGTDRLPRDEQREPEEATT